MFVEDVKDWVDQDFKQARYVGIKIRINYGLINVQFLIDYVHFSRVGVIKYFRIHVMECSALNNFNISYLFKSFLTLSKIDIAVLVEHER